MNYKLIIGLVLICVIIVFIIQNAAIVEIEVFFWTISMSRVLLMFILLALGIMVGWALNSVLRRRKIN